MGQLLSHPLTEKTIIYNDYQAHNIHKLHITNEGHHHASHPQFYNCVGSMQGYRLTQEDAHLVKTGQSSLKLSFYDPFLGKTVDYEISMFAVFDGHGDNNCSSYLAGSLFEHPHNSASHANTVNEHDGLLYFVKSAFESHKYTSYDKPIENRKQFRTIEGLISQVIKDAFKACDYAFHKHFANEASGSTAIVSLIINGSMLYVANTGDSRCILSKKNKASFETFIIRS